MKSSSRCTTRGAWNNRIPFILFCALLPLIGCSEEKTKTPIQPKPAGSLVEYSGCKQFKTTAQAIPQDQDCILYEYDGEGTLLLTHVNAGFNCCPGEIVTDITMEGTAITIVENETESACRCLCLYDLRFEFDELDPGVYTVHVVEPYAEEGDDPLVCTIDLSEAAEGKCCIGRDHYPWMSGGAAGPSGFMIDYDGCKTAFDADDDYPDVDCIEYEYINDNVLRITHVNAGFNCCPGEISAEIAFEGNVVTIDENESQSACDCLCLFDLEYEITDIAPGVYSIRIVEPYLIEGDPPLELTADLISQPRFRCCVERGHYPWDEAGSEADDIAKLKRLKQEILNLIGEPGCTGTGDCRCIAFGAKPCGGPWEYLVYSVTATDADLLVRKVNAYNALNEVMNDRHNWDSDCRSVLEPDIGCVDGVCVDLDKTR